MVRLSPPPPLDLSLVAGKTVIDRLQVCLLETRAWVTPYLQGPPAEDYAFIHKQELFGVRKREECPNSGLYLLEFVLLKQALPTCLSFTLVNDPN